jgi:hypothetical protein
LHIGAGRQLAAIVELNPAEATVVQLAAGEPLERVQRTGKHPVDFIRTVKPRYAGASAPGTPDVMAKMERVLARNQFFILAIPAFVYGEISKTFQERPMDPFKTATPAVPALPHCGCYTSIAHALQLARR